MSKTSFSFTRRESFDLDLENRQLRHPDAALRVDPVLWDAFSVDREESPRPEPKPLPVHMTKQKQETPSNCRGCDIALRPAHTSVVDYPGTRRLEGNGFCNSCARRRRRHRAKAEKVTA